MTIAPKQDLRLFKGSLDNLKLKPVVLHIQPELQPQKPGIQVLTKPKKTDLNTEILF